MTIARSAGLADNHAMAIHALFPTLIYRESIAGPDQRRLNQDLADECRSLAASDAAGRRWSAKHYLGGYTSYGSLDRLHLAAMEDLGVRRLMTADEAQAAAAKALGFEVLDLWSTA